ncbi:protease Do [Lewinellaceae bacterium SD302]|nr:protease Do [Lewinellaceae bacterium SD302]
MTNKQLFTLIGCCLFSSLLSVAIYASIVGRNQPSVDPFAEPNTELKTENTARPTMPVDFTRVAEKTTPSVVYIRSFFDRESRWEPAPSSSSGSGVIISSDGYIATNNHVISGASRITVMLDNQSEYEAEVVGVDQTTDLALLRIDETALPYLSFGDSDSLRIGEWVLAGGNPFNLESTVTAGIVSAKGRSIDVLEGEDRIESFIQTDASVNPGNSGGALVNDRGQLIGIVTAILTTSGRHEGYAFAIPGNLARRIFKDLRDYGEVNRAVLGVYVQKINAAQAERLELEETKGALIARMRKGGSAERAGMQENDVIRSIDGTSVGSPAEMQEAISRYRPGDEVNITFIRNGELRKIRVLLLDKENLVPNRQLVSRKIEDDLLDQLGIDLRPLSHREQQENDLEGLRVTAVFLNSIAAAANLEAGYLITKVNDQPVSSIEGLLSKLVPGEEVQFTGYYPKLKEAFYYRFTVPGNY